MTKKCPNCHEVERGDADGDHEPGDSEARCYHGEHLGVEVGLYVEIERKSGQNNLISAP